MNIKAKLYLDGLAGGLALKALLYVKRPSGKRSQNKPSFHEITFIKILGGGSLVALLPALLAIREKYPHSKMTLICSHRIANYADSIGVFDRVQLIDGNSLVSSVTRLLKAVFIMSFRSEILVDLEYKSNLTTVFSALSFSKLKLGLIESNGIWKKNFYDQILFVRVGESLPEAYDRLAELFSTKSDLERSRLYLQSQLTNRAKILPADDLITIGVGGSDFFPERRMKPQEWKPIVLCLLENFPSRFKICFLGNEEDYGTSEQIISSLPGFEKRLDNLCGKLSLADSLTYLQASKVYLGIDSGLMQFAGLIGPLRVGFWGPTQARIQLKRQNHQDLHLSKSLSCSPCLQKRIQGRLSCQGTKPCMDHGLEADKIILHLRGAGILEKETPTIVESSHLKFSLPTPI